MWDENTIPVRSGRRIDRQFRPMAKKRARRKDTRAIDRAAKRAAQKAAGAFDGRFRERTVPSGRRYRRTPKHPPAADEE